MVERVRVTSPKEDLPVLTLKVGQRLLIEKRFSEADPLFKAMREKWPRDGAVLYGAALIGFNLGRTIDAELTAREAVKVGLAALAKHEVRAGSGDLRLSTVDGLVLLAVIVGAKGDQMEALKIIESAVLIAPRHFDAQFTLGRARYSVGDSEGAARAFRAALALRPDDVRAQFFLATALERSGDADAALAAYRQLVVRQPEAAEGHLGLGVLLIRHGYDVQQGIEELKRVVSIDPNLYEARVILGRALVGRNRAEESIEHLRRATELEPGNPEPHYQLSRAYRKLGRRGQAEQEAAIVKQIHEKRRTGDAPNAVITPNN